MKCFSIKKKSTNYVALKAYLEKYEEKVNIKQNKEISAHPWRSNSLLPKPSIFTETQAFYVSCHARPPLKHLLY